MIMNSGNAWNIFTAAGPQLPESDPWGRVLHRDMLAGQVNEPVVSNFLFKNGFRPHYPEKRSFAVCISHDIDHLMQPGLSVENRTKAAVKDLLSGHWSRTLRYLDPRNPINPNYNLEELVKKEKKLRIPATYYFLALKPSEKDYNYDLKDVEPFFKMISENGSEIGLHGGHEAFVNGEKMTQEKKFLEAHSRTSVIGYRNHFLRFKNPDTWRNLVASGFEYDTTFGFPDHPGFRNGMCYPFFPYDRETRDFLNILEIPLLVMDATFLYYLRCDQHTSLRYIKKIVDQVRAVNGVFTLLWHNNYFYKPWGDVFHSVVDYCKTSDAWFTTGQELNEWWRTHHFCQSYKQYGLSQPAL